MYLSMNDLINNRSASKVLTAATHARMRKFPGYIGDMITLFEPIDCLLALSSFRMVWSLIHDV